MMRSVSSGKAAFLGGILFLTALTILCAQSPGGQSAAQGNTRQGHGAQGSSGSRASLDQIPALRERAVIMRCVSRIVEKDQRIEWNMENSWVTIPGRPVGLRLVGSNLVVVVQFTPFLRRTGQHTLIAQGQIWINVPNEGVSYHTTMQSIPLELNEQVYFFPLGSKETADEAYIEIQVVLEPYLENSPSLNNNTDEEPENPTPP